MTDTESVQVRLDELRLENPRQWGACWLGDHLWRTLHLDDFFGARLAVSPEGTHWEKVLRVLAIYWLLAPGIGVAAAPALVFHYGAGRPAGPGCARGPG